MINLAREAWRPLFLREPVAQRGWSLVTRGLRAYLLQVAEDDGRLLKACCNPCELALSLGVHREEMELVKAAIGVLIEDGFLRWEGTPGTPGWLGIDRLVTFGPSEPEDEEEPSAEPLEPMPEPVIGETIAELRRRQERDRKRRWRGKSRGTGARDSVPRKGPSVHADVPGHVPSDVPGTGAGHVPSVPVPSRPSPPTPPSPGDKNTKKTGQNRETPTRGVPGHVPPAGDGTDDGTGHGTGTVAGDGTRDVPRDVLTLLTTGDFDQAQALVRGSAAGESQEAAP